MLTLNKSKWLVLSSWIFVLNGTVHIIITNMVSICFNPCGFSCRCWGAVCDRKKKQKRRQKLSIALLPGSKDLGCDFSETSILWLGRKSASTHQHLQSSDFNWFDLRSPYNPQASQKWWSAQGRSKDRDVMPNSLWSNMIQLTSTI